MNNLSSLLNNDAINFGTSVMRFLSIDAVPNDWTFWIKLLLVIIIIMTTPKVKPNALPVSFEQFKKNPIAAVAFCMLLAVSYLYFDLRSGYKEQIEKSNQKIDALDLKIDRLSYALKKSDSALAAAITEIRIMNTMRKL